MSEEPKLSNNSSKDFYGKKILGAAKVSKPTNMKDLYFTCNLYRYETFFSPSCKKACASFNF